MVVRSSSTVPVPWLSPIGGLSPWVGLVGWLGPWVGLVGGPGPWVGLVGGWGPWFYCELWNCECLLWWRNAVGIIDNFVGRNSHVETFNVLPGQSCHTSQEVILRVDVF